MALKANTSDLNNKMTGTLLDATKVEMGRSAANGRTFLRVYASPTLLYQLEMVDNGSLIYAKQENGTWTTLWTK